MARNAPCAALLVFLACLFVPGCVQTPLTGRGMLVPEEAVGLRRGTFDLLDARLREAHHRREIPGGVLAVARDGRIVYLRAFGLGDPALLYDTASLSKPLLGPGVLHLAGKEAPGLQHRAATALANQTQWDDDGGYGLLLAELMAATPGHVDGIIARRLEEAPAPAPGVYMYSNTAHALLGLELAGSVDGAEEALLAWLTATSGTDGFAFRPDRKDVARSGARADGSDIRGRPFDPLADVMLTLHGVPPLHSGLFARADSAALAFSRMLESRKEREWLFAGLEERTDARSGRTVFISRGGLRSPTGNPWAPDGSRPGRYFVQPGYTGCLFWVDTDLDIVAVLLTNASAGEKPQSWELLAWEVVRAIRQGSV